MGASGPVPPWMLLPVASTVCLDAGRVSPGWAVSDYSAVGSTTSCVAASCDWYHWHYYEISSESGRTLPLIQALCR